MLRSSGKGLVLKEPRESKSARVVILRGGSLFTEGVTRRLQDHLGKFDLQIVDARQCDAIDQIVAAHPTAVILDNTDPGVGEGSIRRLLGALPCLKVVCLNPARVQVQVIQWEQQQASEVRDLVRFLGLLDEKS